MAGSENPVERCTKIVIETTQRKYNMNPVVVLTVAEKLQYTVTPAKAGVQKALKKLVSRFRGKDIAGRGNPFLARCKGQVSSRAFSLVWLEIF